jgi:hypothetical protein
LREFWEAVSTSSLGLPYFSSLAIPDDLAHSLLNQTCPYRKSNPYVLMMQPTKDGPPFDTPSELNDPSNRCILA